jgi:hypothetical protein
MANQSDKRSITLFSPYSPRIGGGGAILRSLIPRLTGLDVTWLYTADRDQEWEGAEWIGPGLTGGSPARDLSRALLLWSRVETGRLREVTQALLAQQSDGYWILAHNEGTLVARALMRRGAAVHLSVQDDVPDGIFGRSNRYRWLAPLARPTYDETMKRAVSVDVICEGMRRYYNARLGVDATVVHRWLPPLAPSPASPGAADELHVGHIGTIYAAGEWRAFLAALRAYATARGLRPRMTMIGLAERYRPLASEYHDIVELVPDTPEPDAVTRLQRCDFVYAMYPFDARADVFRRTSLPTKVSSYLLCQRKIFGHAPAASSLADVLRAHDVGVLFPSPAGSPAMFEQAFETIRGKIVEPAAYENARAALFGDGNVRRLQTALSRIARPPLD